MHGPDAVSHLQVNLPVPPDPSLIDLASQLQAVKTDPTKAISILAGAGIVLPSQPAQRGAPPGNTGPDTSTEEALTPLKRQLVQADFGYKIKLAKGTRKEFVEKIIENWGDRGTKERAALHKLVDASYERLSPKTKIPRDKETRAASLFDLYMQC